MDLRSLFQDFFPSKNIPRLSLRYSGKFKAYNATVHYTLQSKTITEIEFRLSREFEEVDELIQTGLLQHLLNRVYKTNKQTVEQDLYDSFLKRVVKYQPPKESDPQLVELFHVLNEQYFDGRLDMPTLRFGKEAFRTLGHYHYQSDTVTISPILLERKDLLSFVLYHELLHKKHGFETSSSGRNHYHTPAFRRDEKKFHIPDVEKQLEQFISKKKRRFRFF